MTFTPPQPPSDSSALPQSISRFTPQKNSPLAWISLGFGIGGVLLFFVGPLLGLIAIITGHIARRQIRRDPEKLKGSGAALTGLITGYLAVIVGSALIAASILLPVALNEMKDDIKANVESDVQATVAQVKTSGDYSEYSVIQTSADTEVQILVGANPGEFVVIGHSPDLDRDNYLYTYVSNMDKYFVAKGEQMCADEANGACMSPDELIQQGLGTAAGAVVEPVV